MKFELPIYWEQLFKAKKSKFHLVGLNQLFGMHYQPRNNLKKHYYSLIATLSAGQVVKGPYKVQYKLYFKNVVSDPSNIIAGIEKVTLDGLQLCGGVEGDNPKFHKGTSWTVEGQDKLNPRVEIAITPTLSIIYPDTELTPVSK